MNTRTAFSSAIGILTSDDIDYRAIVIRLAQVNPTLFVKLATPAAVVTPTPAKPAPDSKYTKEWAKEIYDNLPEHKQISFNKVIGHVIAGSNASATNNLNHFSPNSYSTDQAVIEEFVTWLMEEYNLSLSIDGVHVSHVNKSGIGYTQTLDRLRAAYIHCFR